MGSRLIGRAHDYRAARWARALPINREPIAPPPLRPRLLATLRRRVVPALGDQSSRRLLPSLSAQFLWSRPHVRRPRPHILRRSFHQSLRSCVRGPLSACIVRLCCGPPSPSSPAAHVRCSPPPAAAVVIPCEGATACRCVSIGRHDHPRMFIPLNPSS